MSCIECANCRRRSLASGAQVVCITCYQDQRARADRQEPAPNVHRAVFSVGLLLIAVSVVVLSLRSCFGWYSL